MRTSDLDTDLIAGLRRIMPPAALIHVGAGRGTGAMHQWRDWDVPAAWLVDAEPAQLAWAERLAAIHPGWQVCPALLAESDGETPYYRASNPAESGLVPTSRLAALWPNLREEEHGGRPGTRLDTLLAGSAELPGGAGWWLIVDCLPALRVLQGAPETLDRCSVLWLRALLQPLPETEPGAALEELQAFLAPLGFRCVQITESNHPALGETVFVRDWAQRLQPVIDELHAGDAQRQEQNRQLSARLAEQEAATQATAQERNAQAGLAAERQAQLATLAKEKSELSDRFAQLDKDHAAVTAALKTAQADLAARTGERDAQAKLATERQAQLDALAKEKAELSDKLAAEVKRHTELAGKSSQLEKDLAAVTAALKAAQANLAARTGERDAQVKLAGERQAQLESLGKEKTELSGKLATEASRHTALSDKFSQLEKDHAAATASLKAAQADLAARTGERDAQARLAGERQAKLDVLAKEKTELAAKLDGQSEAHAELVAKLTAVEAERNAKDDALKATNADLGKRTAERDAQARLAAERQAQLDALDKDKAALVEQLAAANTAKQDQSKRGDTLQGQVEQLTKARDEQAKLASERASQLTQLTTQRDKLHKENQSLTSDVQARDAAIGKLNEQIAEQDQRERQLVEEIVRAEGQIELIKDLLLREGGL